MKFDDIFGVHAQALQVRTKRSEILASNLANADTPGYKARDIDFSQMLNQSEQSAVRILRTDQRHIQPDNDLIPPMQLLYRTPMQPSLDGNTVDTEQEHVAFSANAMEYQVSLRFLNDKISGLRKAIRGE
ncbi:MAG: flagellar basal body rod protein FlgB [Chromatiales bacterium]|jgi:flagellar basal-body rod protein FlgB